MTQRLVLASATPVIELLAVSKDYHSDGGVVHALRETTLTVNLGEFVAIVGTSGSGKSTMMNILGCLDRPTSGVYRLAGFDVGRRSEDARTLIRNCLIGFIFQGFNLLPRTTALENVELPLTYRGMSRAERRKRATAALTAVGLEHRLTHRPNELSGGQQQRVAIARALVTDPPMILADEPTGNLDTRTSLEVLSFLQKLNRERRITIVLVTHEPDIAACATRVIAMRDGTIVSDTRNVPTDAAALLRALPPSAVVAPSPMNVPGRNASPKKVKVPGAVYVALPIGALVGLGCGFAYDKWILAHDAWWPPLVCAILGECMFAERVAHARLGKIGPAIAARMTLAYSLVLALIAAGGVMLNTTWWPAAMVRQLASSNAAGIAATASLAVGGILATVLVRSLLIVALSASR